MKKTYIGKAEPNQLLCHGIDCPTRERCLKYNLEPQGDHPWIEGRGPRGDDIGICMDMEPVEEIKREED